MARMSRKELQKKVELLEKMVFNLATMHNTISSELAKPLSFGQRMPHPKSLVAQNPAKTSYGWVSFEDLTKFVVDGEPLKFVEKDKELVKEVYPDGKVVNTLRQKEKSPYEAPKTVPYYIQGRDYSWYLETMYDKVKKMEIK